MFKKLSLLILIAINLFAFDSNYLKGYHIDINCDKIFLTPNTNYGMNKAKLRDFLVDLETIEKECGVKLLKSK